MVESADVSFRIGPIGFDLEGQSGMLRWVRRGRRGPDWSRPEEVVMSAPGRTEFVTRAFTFAEPGDTLQALADRVLPGDLDGRDQLLAWNPHLTLRAPTMDAPGGLLPTDVVYTEPAAPR